MTLNEAVNVVLKDHHHLARKLSEADLTQLRHALGDAYDFGFAAGSTDGEGRYKWS